MKLQVHFVVNKAGEFFGPIRRVKDGGEMGPWQLFVPRLGEFPGAVLLQSQAAAEELADWLKATLGLELRTGSTTLEHDGSSDWTPKEWRV